MTDTLISPSNAGTPEGLQESKTADAPEKVIDLRDRYGIPDHVTDKELHELIDTVKAEMQDPSYGYDRISHAARIAAIASYEPVNPREPGRPN